MNRTEKTFMPIWQPFTGKTTESMIRTLSDEEERTLALAAHYHFQARYEDAARESGRCLNSSCPEIRAAALFIHGMTNVGLGNVQLIRADIAALRQAAQQPKRIPWHGPHSTKRRRRHIPPRPLANITTFNESIQRTKRKERQYPWQMNSRQ